jgi:hypothetical protein
MEKIWETEQPAEEGIIEDHPLEEGA